jgi:hypothetical protein
MAVLNTGNVAPKQAGALFDIALRELLGFAERAETITYYHGGIISDS